MGLAYVVHICRAYVVYVCLGYVHICRAYVVHIRAYAVHVSVGYAHICLAYAVHICRAYVVRICHGDAHIRLAYAIHTCLGICCPHISCKCCPHLCRCCPHLSCICCPHMSWPMSSFNVTLPSHHRFTLCISALCSPSCSLPWFVLGKRTRGKRPLAVGDCRLILRMPPPVTRLPIFNLSRSSVLAIVLCKLCSGLVLVKWVFIESAMYM
ncbi:unnamed protein product [Laminaria digitata]